MMDIDKKNLKAFGETLKKHRKTKSLSQRKLAQRCDVEYSSIPRIEQGLVSIQLLTVFELAKGLNIHPKELFNFDFDPENK
ncbi:MAG: helix-turn-helix transcriptional regulator [Cellulophaga sp.]